MIARSARLALAFVCLLAVPAAAQPPATSSDTASIAKALHRGCTNGQVLVKDTARPGEVRCATPATGGSGAPTTATYITQTPQAGLSGEQALSLLSSGILRAATTTGVVTSLGDVLPLANGGTAAALVDPNADRILFWDDSAGAVTWLTAGTNLTISGTSLNATGGANPAGSGSELQYRSNGTTFGAITGSSVSGADVTLGGTISVADGIVSPNGAAGDPATPGTALAITAGAGGAGDANDEGIGGAITITSGTGGAGTTVGTDGAAGGLLSILGGVGGAGDVTPSLGGAGGAILIQAGDSGLGNNEGGVFGGDVTIRTGASTTHDGDGDGKRSGRLLLETNLPSQGFGAGGGGGDSGDIRVFTANGGLSDAADGGASGEIFLKTGNGAAGASAGAAGPINLTSGNGGVPSGDEYGGNAGEVVLTGGNGGTGRGGGFVGGTGGNVTLRSGAPGSGTSGATLGTPGDIRFDASNGGTILAFGPIVADTSVTVTEVAFASLPATPTVGALANVSDSNTATWGANVAAGGANHILARWNGVAWTVVGK